MTRRDLKIGRWNIVFLFAEEDYNTYDVMSYLEDAGAPERVLDRAESALTRGRYNSGLAYTNEVTHQAVVFVGPTTSGDEFINTLVHEIHHLASVIADGLGVDLLGETPAYVAGDAAMALAHTLCDLGCSHCHSSSSSSS
jgi:hypothetical protein